jgi:glycerophosphoryl diester phosphodiesterase
MSVIDALIARPVAHRGLHDGKSIVENTALAFAAAVAAGYGVECDLQVTADREAMVHHDAALGRLTEGNERLDALTAAQLKRVAFKGCRDRLMTLGELCDLVAGRSALLIELKSHFDGDRRLVERTADVLSCYRGSAAVMSFDPVQMAALRELKPALTRGLVAESRRPRKVQDSNSRSRGAGGTVYLHRVLDLRPQFIAYAMKDLPSMMTVVARKVFRLPILAWTVRSLAEWHAAKPHADQMIFEGFRP